MWNFFKRGRRVASVGLTLADDEVVLRDERTAAGRRRLAARIDAGGDLRIEGQDLGEEVRAYFGCDEYEWSWTIRKEHLGALRAALGAADGLLSALQSRFSSDRGNEIGAFLKDHAIPCEFWSRVGD